MAGIKERLIQFILRGKDELSPEAKKSTDALEALRNEAASLNEQLDSAKGERGLVRDMLATQRALEQSQRVLAQTDESIKELRSALNANPDAAGLKQSLKDADREAARLRRVIVGLSSDLGEHEKAAKAAGLDTSKLAEEEKRLAREVDDAKKALKANGQQLRELEREQARASRAAAEHSSQVGAVREAMASGGRQILGYVAAYVSLNAVFGLVRSGLNLVSQGIRAVIADGSDKEQALAQLEATLRSTGNAAGFTAEQLLEMADGFEKSSMLTAEQIQAAQTRLLSYTDIVGDQFPKAMQIAIDQQERLGISAEQSAEIVGRALQSPVEAMGALGRQGFKLEDGQKRLLQRLVATGKTAEAQTVIMNMMTEAYGGAAAAAKINTAAGLWKTLTDQFGDFASRVSNSGAFEFVRNKLKEVSDGLDAMANDGRLDRLAKGLSDAFIQGAQWVEKFARQLADVDFGRLADDSASWLSNFGKHLDETSQKLSAFVLPFRALFNGLTSGMSLAAAAITNKLSEVLGLIEVVAERLPESLGGPKLQAAVQQARGVLDGMTSGFVAQVEQDGRDLDAAWKAALGGVADSTKSTMEEVTETIKLDTVSQADYVRQAVTSMQGALDQLSAAKTVAQLRQIGEEMYAAYQRGDISQQEYSATSVELNRRLNDLGGTTKSMATAVGIAAESLKSLSDVQRAISDAKTDRDIAAIRTALQTLYGNAQITASEYNTELGKLTTRQKELAKAVQGGKKAQDDKNQSDREAIVTSEQLRRESGKRMEAERKAGDDAMQQRRKESSDAKKDMGAVAGFYDGVMNAARGPLASLSAAALEAFDRMRGIKTADMNIDTSSLDATRGSLERVNKALGDVRANMDSPFTGNWGKWQLDMQEASLSTQQAYLGQQARLQSLMDTYSKGSLTTREFVSQARGLRSQLSLLDGSDLSSLEGALKSAQDSMEQMGQSTRSTLDSLRDELDGLQGKTEDIERRRFATRRRELEAQLAEANAGGNSEAVANAARALGMLRQIEAETAQARQADEQRKRQEEIAKAAPAASPAAAQAPQQPSRVIRLELGGKAVDVGVGSAADEASLLSILEDAASRAR